MLEFQLCQFLLQSRRRGCAEEGHRPLTLGPRASRKAAPKCRLGSRSAILVAVPELAMEMERRWGAGCSDSARGEGLAWHWDVPPCRAR